MLSVEEALAQLLAEVAPLPVEEAPLLECLNRVLARDAVASLA